MSTCHEAGGGSTLEGQWRVQPGRAVCEQRDPPLARWETARKPSVVAVSAAARMVRDFKTTDCN